MRRYQPIYRLHWHWLNLISCHLCYKHFCLFFFFIPRRCCVVIHSFQFILNDAKNHESGESRLKIMKKAIELKKYYDKPTQFSIFFFLLFAFISRNVSLLPIRTALPNCGWMCFLILCNVKSHFICWIRIYFANLFVCILPSIRLLPTRDARVQLFIISVNPLMVSSLMNKWADWSAKSMLNAKCWMSHALHENTHTHTHKPM